MLCDSAELWLCWAFGVLTSVLRSLVEISSAVVTLFSIVATLLFAITEKAGILATLCLLLQCLGSGHEEITTGNCTLIVGLAAALLLTTREYSGTSDTNVIVMGPEPSKRKKQRNKMTRNAIGNEGGGGTSLHCLHVSTNISGPIFFLKAFNKNPFYVQ